MKLKNPLLAVTDLAASIAFYKQVLGLRVVMDFGANVTLTGGVCLQTLDSWRALIGGKAVSLGGCAGELYFEEEDFDAFAEKLAGMDIKYVHPVLEHRWGQRAVRFYDPDGYIIEVGETLEAVIRRFLASGMSAQQVVERMDVPLKLIKKYVNG